MSPLLNFNFEDVPDEIKPINPGTYELEVAQVPTITPAKSGNGENLTVTYRVTSEGPFHGRSIKDFIYLNEMGLIKVKQLAVAAGMKLSASGLNTEELLGRKVKALVVNRNYNEEESGETRTRANVSRYLKP